MPAKTEKQRRLFAACSHGANYDSCPKGMSREKMREFARKPKRKSRKGGRRGRR